MIRLLKQLILLATLAWTLPALAGNPVAGEAAASSCVACHGTNGAQPIDNNPIIAGQHEDYLVRSLKAYRDGLRANTVMESLMANYTDIELENLAAYFAAQDSPLE